MKSSFNTTSKNIDRDSGYVSNYSNSSSYKSSFIVSESYQTSTTALMTYQGPQIDYRQLYSSINRNSTTGLNNYVSTAHSIELYQKTCRSVQRHHVQRVCPSSRHIINKGTDNYASCQTFNRLLYCGIDRLDIISLLEPWPMLEYILLLLSPLDAYHMTLVSQHWRSIVLNKKATNNIHSYLAGGFFSKEDCQKSNEGREREEYFKCFSLKSRCFKNIASNIGHNISMYEKDLHAHMSIHQDSFTENQKIVKMLNNNERLVKCPLCGKGSRIFTIFEENFTNVIESQVNIEPNIDILFRKPNENVGKQKMFIKYFSVNVPLKKSTEKQLKEMSYAECTGSLCSFKFCLKCFCKFHPEKNCPISELGTPSKIQQNENLPISMQNNSKERLKFKQKSLKRLCF